MKKSYKQCQSCGMPLKKDEKGGGSEKNGTRSKMYCSLCYENGVFINPGMTVTGMQELVDDVLKNEMNSSKIFRWLAVQQIPKLARWKK